MVHPGNEAVPADPVTKDGTTWRYGQVILLLRWVLIISASYLVLFSRPLGETPVLVSLFVAGYLATNILLTELMPKLRQRGLFEWAVVGIDTFAVSLAMLLTGNASSDFFVLYFVILFVSALTERLGLVVAATLLIVTTYLYTVSQYRPVGELIEQGYMLRVPFLFAVASFFGYLVQNARTRERRAEEDRARAVRMELLSGISHDLKNPLGVIQSLASLMLDGDAGEMNDQQNELTHRIHATARHLFTLSQNLIDAERIEAGRLVVHPQATDLRTVISNALEMARSTSQLKAIHLYSHIEPTLPPAHIDPVQTERVISNLLGNALKFTPKGGTVALTVQRQARSIVLRITDDGPGIEPAALPHLFDKYERTERGTAAGGSGLGLFIVKAVVEAQKGTVDIASELGKGTTVTVTLPVHGPERARRGEAPSTAAAAPVALRLSA